MYTIYFLCNIFRKKIKQQKVIAINFIFTITFDEITVLSVILIQLEKNYFIKRLRKETYFLSDIYFLCKQIPCYPFHYVNFLFNIQHS